ncbi:MAG: patatin-like phospholipase family protein [Alphaproteobacteria bacterium]|nr:patatin-like phospholipase family protein [Alphaproteobacteria bacterium]
MTPTALVLSGGGARGAYEAGVLSWILEDAAARGVRPHLHALCGTSVGAIHAAFLAANLHDPVGASARMNHLWTSLELDRVLRLRIPQALGLWRVVLGGNAGAGMFDPRPLMALVGRAIDWPRIRTNLAQGRLNALTVTATHVATGSPVVFLEAPDEIADPVGFGRKVQVRRDRIGSPHVLASAAIPLVFPPVAIDGDLYADGGLRLNTPMGPAIRLGARKLLVIALNRKDDRPELGTGRYPGAPFLLGKVLDAFLLDHVDQDLENLERVNRLLADVRAAGGDDVVARMAEDARARGDAVHHPVDALAIHPSQDLGELAGDHLRRLSVLGRGGTVHALLKLVDVGEGSGSDLASYLLFDRAYTRELLELGRADAEREGDRLRSFLGWVVSEGDGR